MRKTIIVGVSIAFVLTLAAVLSNRTKNKVHAQNPFPTGCFAQGITNTYDCGPSGCAGTYTETYVNTSQWGRNAQTVEDVPCQGCSSITVLNVPKRITNVNCPLCNPDGPQPLDCEQGAQIWCERRCMCTSTEAQCLLSPVVVDVAGNGFTLTNETNGVDFDLDSNDQKERLGWTRAGSDDAWLALDRNSNGRIDNGSELFGNFTSQPEPPTGQERNGFLALAEFDKPVNGGNADGMIDNRDTIFPSLRLWQDTRHNGISETAELKTVSQFGLKALDLGYKKSKRIDQFGNEFRYRAKVKDTHGAQMGRWAWDVFLISSP